MRKSGFRHTAIISSKRDEGRQILDRMTYPEFALELPTARPASLLKSDRPIVGRFRQQGSGMYATTSYSEDEGTMHQSSVDLRRRIMEMRSSLRSTSGRINIEEEIAQREYGNEYCNSSRIRFPRDSIPDSVPHGWIERYGDNNEQELWRHHELGLTAGPSRRTYDLTSRELALLEARQYQEEEMRRQYVRDVQRCEILRREQQAVDLDWLYRGQRDQQLLDRQPRNLLVEASATLDLDMDFARRERILAEHRISRHGAWSEFSERAGTTEYRSVPISRRTTSTSPLYLPVSSTSAVSESYSPLKSQEIIDAAMLVARRAVQESTVDTSGASSKTSSRRFPSSDHEESKVSPMSERESLFKKSRQTDTTESMRTRICEVNETSKRGLLPHQDHDEFDCHIQKKQKAAPANAPFEGRTGSDPTKRLSEHLSTGKVHRLRAKLLPTKAKCSSNVASPLGEGIARPSIPTSNDLMNPLRRLLDHYSAGGTKEASFPLKLHAILADPRYHDIIGWLPHGKSWKVFKVSLFEQILLPRHFRHGKYASFMRQGKNPRLFSSPWTSGPTALAHPYDSLWLLFYNSQWLGVSTQISPWSW